MRGDKYRRLEKVERVLIPPEAPKIEIRICMVMGGNGEPAFRTKSYTLEDDVPDDYDYEWFPDDKGLMG
jgi:hypothetical protein